VFGLYLLALVLAVATAKGSSGVDWAAVARCETGGDWRMRGPTYSGGVGFYNGTWAAWARELGLYGRYPNAADAPRAVQVRVAAYGYRVHHGAWGCIREHPEYVR